MATAARTSPFLALAVPAAALLLGAARWLWQGSGNLYTDADKRLFVPDPDLGWRAVDGPVWLGLDALAVLLACLVAVALGAWAIHRRERARANPWRAARLSLWALALVPLAVPLAAIGSGFGPSGARDRLPTDVVEAPDEGVEGSLVGLPPGTYDVAEHRGSRVVARIAAGGESFDAIFPTLRGHWRGAPADLRQPMQATVTADAAAIDTGVRLRSKHAREDYLYTGRFPELRFTLDRLLAAAPDADGAIAFRAEGTVELMGRQHRVPVTGTLRALDADGRQRLGIDAGAAMIITAATSLSIPETALADDLGDFDAPDIPIAVSLVLTHRLENPTP